MVSDTQSELSDFTDSDLVSSSGLVKLYLLHLPNGRYRLPADLQEATHYALLKAEYQDYPVMTWAAYSMPEGFTVEEFRSQLRRDAIKQVTRNWLRLEREPEELVNFGVNFEPLAVGEKEEELQE